MVRVDQEKVATEERRLALIAQLGRLDPAYLERVEDLTSRLAQGLDTVDFDGRREPFRLLVDEGVCDDGCLSMTIRPLRRLSPAPRGLR